MGTVSQTDPRESGEDRIEIDTRYAAERWQYVCPSGHIDWRVQQQGFVCLACEEFGDDPEFAALIDRRSRVRVPRSQVRVIEGARWASE